MTASYELRLFAADGTPKARITDFGPLSCVSKVNNAGMLSTTLRGDHPAIAFLEHKSHVELWRSDADNGIAPYCYWGGLYLKQEWQTPDTVKFNLTAPGYLWLLTKRYIGYYAGTANQTEFTNQPAETIMKALVNNNAGPAATVANGRVRNGVISGLSIQTDGGAGNSLDWFCAYKPLLENLQDLALIAGGDFDLVKTGSDTFEFRWYIGQLGTNRVASVVFSMGKANMAEPDYIYDRIAEKTVAIVGGQGVENARTIAIRTGPDYVSDNDNEIFVPATNADTADGYNSAGDKKLQETRAVKEFTFKVLQVPSCLYGRDYFLGDKCTAINPYTGANVTVKISGATLKLDQDGIETIDLTLENV